MFDPSSRYYNLETATLTVSDTEPQPREIRYVRWRFIPRSENATTLLEHTVTEGDRLDNITAHYLGDPSQFWRICDGNNVLHPEELEEIGRTLKISLSALSAVRPF